MIVSRSGGAYTHDAVFELDAIFVKKLELMFYEQDCYEGRLHEAKENNRE